MSEGVAPWSIGEVPTQHLRGRLFDVLHARFDDRYLPLLMCIGALLVPALAIPGVALTFGYAGLPFARFPREMAFVLPWMTLVGVVAETAVARALAPLRAWRRAGRLPEGAGAAWHAATAAFPRAHMVGALIVIIGALPAGVFVWLDVDGGVTDAVIGLFVVPLFIVGCRILQYLVWEEALKPLVAEAAAVLPSEFERSVGSLSLSMKVVVVVPAVGGVVGLALGSFARIDVSPGRRALMLFALLVALIGGVALPLTLMLRRSLIGSMDRLLASMQRVHDGHLDARLLIMTGDELGTVAERFNAMLTGLNERERIRDLFGTYVDRDVAEHLLTEGTAVEGEEVEVTLLFLDIRGFTPLAERTPATEVVAMLNRLFGAVVPIIRTHGGHVDKYVGDGLLAVFGAPRRQADHADHALAAAFEIVDAVDRLFNGTLSVGIGLNSGAVNAGSIGGGGRLEFSVIGDAVNVASRVEAATRQTGDRILLAERTKSLLVRSRSGFVERADVTLRGKSQPVAVYAPVISSSV